MRNLSILHSLSAIRAKESGLHTRVSDLTCGGVRQRLAVARALLKDPLILILDVATSALDSESERLVQEALERLMVERSALVIAHRFSTIRKANRIIVLVDRTIAEEGIHDELLEPKTEYHTLPAGSLALKKLALVLVRAFSFAFALPRLSSLGVFLWAILSSWTYQNVLYIGATSWT